MSVGSKAGLHRRILSWPVFGLTLGALITGVGGAQAAGSVLPAGGRVTAGAAAIGPPRGGVLNITQTSSKAIIDWNSFSIGAGAAVRFDNGAGATLNRVTGAGVSSLNGLLSGSGSVYLVNPNGVIIGRSGVVDVGGTFVASTLDVADSRFLQGGALSFTGSSPAAVVNLGKVGSLGGDVALIAAQVSNAGLLSAPKGSTGLIAGYQVVLRDASLDDGRFSVLVGGAGTRATNSGLIQAADAELRAEGGNVYALAGDTTGVIRATGVKAGGGKVWLVANGGTLDLGGAITAQGVNGAPGSVETSGATVHIDDAAIDAHGGTWLVDPYDLTIDAPAATTIMSALSAGTSVFEQTTATGSSGEGIANASGAGDIIVAAPISWSTPAGLTLSAYRNVDVNAPITASGGGAVTLYADNTGTGVGTVSFGSSATVSTSGAVNIFYNPASNPVSSIVNATSYTNSGNYGADLSGGGVLNTFMLVNTVFDLQNVQNNLSGNYVQGRDIDASLTSSGFNGGSGFTPIGAGAIDSAGKPIAATQFAGLFDGQSYTISGLTISQPLTTNLGLFGSVGPTGVIRNVSLIGGTINGTDFAGGLAGSNSGLLRNVDVTGSVNGKIAGGLVGSNTGIIQNSAADTAVVSLSDTFEAGGLVGLNLGSIANSYAAGAVSGNGFVGGLAGQNLVGGVINDAYSVAAVTGLDSNPYAHASYFPNYAGGLVGANGGLITNTYASGVVTGSITAGLVAINSTGDLFNRYAGTVRNSFWDVSTTGQGADAGGATGLTTAQFMNASSPISGLGLGAIIGGAGFVIVDTDGTLNGANGATRPLLLSEYSTSIVNAHQLQLVALAPNAEYTLAADIDAGGTASVQDVWGASEFMPLGSTSSPFSGALNGQNFVIDNLAINRPGTASVGLFGVVSGTIADLGLVGESVVGGGVAGSATGGLAASLSKDGSIANAFSEVMLSSGGGGPSGGLVGINNGSITDSHASGILTATSYNGGEVIGGLVGSNTGSISTSYANGSVSGAIPKGGGLVISAGGLVGYNNGTLTDVYATGAVKGGVAGGLVAYNIGGSIINAYATGTVFNGDSRFGDDDGGLVAINSGAISGAYYDQGTTGQVVGVGSSDGSPVSQTGVTAIGGITGLSPYAASTYGSFSFGGLGSGSTWVIGGPFGSSLAGIRPLLSSEYSTTITNAHQLQLIALNLTANYTLAADVDASGTSNRSDIWANGFVPLGSGYLDAGGQPEPRFTGRLDGEGHTISGLNIPDPSSEFVGLFGYIASAGIVSNLTLAGGYVIGLESVGALAGENDGIIRNVSASTPVNASIGTDSSGHAAGGDLIGGLVGVNTGVIDGSSASGAVTGLSLVGGLVGGNLADPGVAIIENSHASGAVTEIGGGEAGGLVGQSGTSSVKTPSLINDYATGPVIGTGGDGGLVGDVNSGLVQASYATGTVTAANPTYGNLAPSYFQGVADVGGLVGYIGHVQATTLTNDYATGAVSGAAQVGGLVGGMRLAGGAYPAAVTLQNDYATGDVSGDSSVGGLVGYNVAAVSGGYATGTVSGPSGKATQAGGLIGDNAGVLSQDSASGAVSGNIQVGGLVGYNTAAISNSFATGAVNGASGKTAAGSGAQIGGLVGDNLALLTNDFAQGSVSGYAKVGGLVGRNEASAAISASYASGAIFGASGKATPPGSGAQVGGLVGENVGLVSASDATGTVNGASQLGGLVGRNDGSAVVSMSYATGAVGGASGKASQVGGLVGDNAGQVSNAYATGAVSGGSGKGALAGTNESGGAIGASWASGRALDGFAGTNDGILSADVFDAGTTGTTTGVGSGSSNGLAAIGGSTGFDPHLASSYPGFDFSNVWTINPGASRPFLLATPQSPPPS